MQMITRYSGKNCVAFETTVLSHGLPYPHNFEFVKKIRRIADDFESEAVFLGIVNGNLVAGMDDEELELFCKSKTVKVGEREMEISMGKKENASTTVSATIFLASFLGLNVACTGGMGGVHPGLPQIDISADLVSLSRHPAILVCSGAKSILDLPATVELMESLGITIVGYKTDSFPMFYVKGGIKKIPSVSNVDEIVEIWNAHKFLRRPGTLVVANPCPEDVAFTQEEFEELHKKSLEVAQDQIVSQKDVTPFLLSRIAEFSQGKSLKANLALLESNFCLACQIATSI